jgi:hypothetical protein
MIPNILHMIEMYDNFSSLSLMQISVLVRVAVVIFCSSAQSYISMLVVDMDWYGERAKIAMGNRNATLITKNPTWQAESQRLSA